VRKKFKFEKLLSWQAQSGRQNYLMAKRFEIILPLNHLA
jgi:hypothetical protein